MSRIDLLHLPSAIYRVSVKALIFDDRRRVLVLRNRLGLYEIPGGGWEHDDESLEACVRRELLEELGVEPAAVSPILCTYRGRGNHSSNVLRLVVEARLALGTQFTPSPEEGLVATEFVDKAQFLRLNFERDDENVPQIAAIIWPPKS